MATFATQVQFLILCIFAGLLGLTVLAAFGLALRRSGVFARAQGMLRSSPLAWLCVVPLVCVLVVCGSTKSGGETNAPSAAQGFVLQPTVPTFSEEERRRGFVVFADSGETFDFAPPSHATIDRRGRLRGSQDERRDIAGARVFTRGWMIRNGATNQILKTDLTIVPESRWPRIGNATSCFWTASSPTSETFTWHHALAGGDPLRPVSLQAEFFANGDAVYRYSPAPSDLFATNALPSIAFRGEPVAFSNAFTSLVFRDIAGLGDGTRDTDGDGLPDAEEVFFCYTDPRAADTDLDGLSDADEFDHGLDPRDPFSNGGPLTDGLFVQTGGEDPFSFPPGSTNTVLEHVFYGGSTNAAATPPSPSEATAVLRVTVRIDPDAQPVSPGCVTVAGRAIPFLTNAPDGIVTLLVGIPRNEEVVMTVLPPGGVPASDYGVDITSEDFTLGGARGDGFWFRCPYIAVDTACIHDMDGQTVSVSLRGSPDVRATWPGGDGLTAESTSATSATLTAAKGTPLSKTWLTSVVVTHPDYLFGRTEYEQYVRFCPNHRSDDPNPEPGPSPPDPDDGVDGDDHEDHDWCDAHDCCACLCPWMPHVGTDGVDPTDPPNTNDVETVVVTNFHTGILHLRAGAPPQRLRLAIRAREGAPCCPCPSHGAPYISHVTSRNVIAREDSGRVFNGGDGIRTESFFLNVTGISPSRMFNDSTLVVSYNGKEYEQFMWTAFGAEITRAGKGGGRLPTALFRPSSGMAVLPFADRLSLAMTPRIDLPGATVTVELRDAVGDFEVRLPGSDTILCSTAGETARTWTLAAWREDFGAGSPAFEVVSLNPCATAFCRVALRVSFEHGGAVYADEDVVELRALPAPFAPDYDHDGSINTNDYQAARSNTVYRFWTNEDKSRGRVATASDSIHNSTDDVVNGAYDRVNFLPVSLRLGDLLNALPGHLPVTVDLSAPDGAFGWTLLALDPETCGLMQRGACVTHAGEPFDGATLVRSGHGFPIPDAVLTRIRHGERFLLAAEARLPVVSELSLWICVNGEPYLTYSVPVRMSPVLDMFRTVSHRAADAGPSLAWWLRPRPNELGTNGKTVFFVHGFHVTRDGADVWNGAMFKRLWHSGSRAAFVGVTWDGNEGANDGALNYHGNVVNAFETAPALAALVNGVSGEKVVMAHSLGNMVVSSAIQDHGMQVAKYFMLNAAVPAEAYNAALFDASPSNILVHDHWRQYLPRTWACLWHERFDAPDDRAKLTWRGRFADVAQVAYNFYSSGDEVFELYSQTPSATTGMTSSLARYSWHKQESFKGRAANLNALMSLAATDWSGWGFRGTWEQDSSMSQLVWNSLYTVAQANAILPDDLKTNTVFNLNPQSMNTNVITRATLDEHLAKGIPALSAAAGRGACDFDEGHEYDLSNSRFRPNEWWRTGNDDLDKKWLHSDVKDAAYFYIYMVFDQFIAIGGLK